MCLPAAAFAAMGASTGTAGMLSMGSSLLSAGFSMFGASQKAQAERDMADYNARVAENNAALSEIQALDAKRRGDEEASSIRRQNDQLKGQQRVNMAAKGLDLSSGTASELLAQTDYFSLVDQQTTKDNASREAWTKRQQAANFRGDADMQRRKSASSSPGMAAVTSLISSAPALASKWFS